jgi:hypothetical protein
MAYAKVELCFDALLGQSISLELNEDDGDKVKKWLSEGKEPVIFWELEI